MRIYRMALFLSCSLLALGVSSCGAWKSSTEEKKEETSSPDPKGTLASCFTGGESIQAETEDGAMIEISSGDYCVEGKAIDFEANSCKEDGGVPGSGCKTENLLAKCEQEGLMVYYYEGWDFNPCEEE